MLFRFVAGNKLHHALNIGEKMIKKGKTPIINYICENVNIENQGKIFQEYNNLIHNVNSNYNIALKLSSLNFNKLLIYELADKCKEKNIKLIIDAEDNNKIEKYRNIVNYMIKKYNSNNVNIIKTYQMYRKDSMDELNNDIIEFKKSNTLLAPKLVRGAYFNSEYDGKHLYKFKEHSDANYNNAIVSCINNDLNYTMLATHNMDSIKLGMQLNKKRKIFTFANLMGMNNSNIKKINNKFNKKYYYTKYATYIPYGPYNNMLPYLTRRLYENIDQIKYLY